MSVNLKDQIRNHYRAVDASQEAIEWAEIVARLENEITILAAPRGSRRSGIRVAIAVGAATILLIGLLPLLIRNDAQPPSATNMPTTLGESAPTTVAETEPTWSKVPATESGLGEGVIRRVAAGGPGLVAVGATAFDHGDPAIWTSVDGATWTRVTVDDEGGSEFAAIVKASGSGLIGVGEGVWTSADGLAWSPVPDPDGTFGNAEPTSVTVGGPGLVAVGVEGGGTFDIGAVWTSVDGTIWSRVPHDDDVFGERRAGVDITMSQVTAGGPGLVAVGKDWSNPDADAVVWTSEDGFEWTRVPHDENVFGGSGHQAISDVIATDSGLVAVGTERAARQQAVVWTSVDGLTWTRVPRPENGDLDGGQMNSVVVVDSGLVAVGWEGWTGGPNSRPAVWTSPDGIVWSRVPHDKEGIGSGLMWDVISTEKGLVAVGSDGTNAVVWLGPGS